MKQDDIKMITIIFNHIQSLKKMAMNREIQYMNQAYLGYLAIPRGTILTIGDGHWGTDQKCLPWQRQLLP